jgi:hypothetical protein
MTIEGPMLFYNQVNGQWATGVMEPRGNYRHVFASEPGSFGHWTHIAGAGNGAIMFYDANSGRFSTGTLSIDGSFSTIFVSEPNAFSTWTHVVGDGTGLVGGDGVNGAMLFYNQANGQWATGVVEPGGNYRHVFASEPGSFGHWTHIAGAGNGAIMFYDANSGRFGTGTLSIDGSFSTIFVSEPNAFSTWTHIVGGGVNGAMLFYNQANGQWATGVLGGGGIYVHVFASEPGSFGHWTHIAGAGNGAIMFYDANSGWFGTGTLSIDGSFSTIFVSEPNAFSTWTHVIGEVLRLKSVVLLDKLACHKTEDSTGADEAYLTYDGERIWGPTSINDGQVRSILISKSINGQAEVALHDEDSGILDPDDFLGSITISGDEAGLGQRVQRFTRDGANYSLFYVVL